MVIRQTNTLAVEPLEDFAAFLESQERIFTEVVEDVVRDNRPEILNELQTEPQPRTYPSDYPIEWTSDRQRRAYFATNGFGGGIPYQRTGKLAASWQFLLETNSDGSVSYIFENPSSAAKYVYGSLAQNRNAALRFQQRFHAITGWQPMTDTVQFWVEALDEDIRRQWNRRIGDEFGKIARRNRRAYTR